MRTKWMSATLFALSALANAQLYSPVKGKGQTSDYPLVGFGAFGVGGYNSLITNDPAVLNMTRGVVKRALLRGYRLVDTAPVYGNERGVGMGIAEALKEGSLKREDFWVSTKLWSDKHNDPGAALKESLQNLGLPYVDLFLMHYPFGETGAFDHIETWRKMQKLVNPNGPVRFIGVSNFSPQQMNDIIQLPGPKPAVHQFELHPYLQQYKFVQWHLDNKIAVAAYAPLANTNSAYQNNYDNNRIPPLLNNSALTNIKNERGCASEAQVALAWNIQRGAAVVVKASKGIHQDENLEVGKCTLKEEDMERIGNFTSREKWVARMNNPCRTFQIPCFRGLDEENGGGILAAFREQPEPGKR